MRWHCRDRVVDVGARAAVMGVLNVTPDSFSDGGAFFSRDQAVARGLRMREEGADLIDVGGESTRPGAQPVPVEEELRRVVPVIEALADRCDAVLSVDTTKAPVARAALAAGAHVINDVSAMTHDAGMLDVARETGAGVVLMHMQGRPRTMQKNPVYDDVVAEVGAYLRERTRAAVEGGLDPRTLCVDPGIGFGKSVEHNLRLLAALPTVCGGEYPILVGVSRKSMIGKLLGRDTPERLAGSLGLMAYAVLRGARVVRVHDVKESCDVVRLLGILTQEEARDARMGEH